ncbi:hypothetical protein [Domibacillus epiphyticus]|uniref:ZIP family metal transporter n=1 Tax=Domibacillus epiphyticus TaxID=1714355 RepID=A0A1V2A540_9BACI|nr:hypothetical protein [Domibacillus epiphyticus]OMP66050.1 hypothetical protein BTO28_14780 [Domibacillus epiphyticus]
MFFWLSLLFAIGFSIIHLSSKYMTFVRTEHRSRFLSFAGGVAVSYVFVHLLPDLMTHQQILERESNGMLPFVENHAYLAALFGLTLFYGLESAVTKKVKQEPSHKGSGVFWVHIVTFFFYNMLIGYLIIQDKFDHFAGMVFYFLALSVHFVMMDQSMRETHQDIYDRYGRWLLSIGVLIGWGIGAITELNEALISTLFAFLAGALVLNVLKEEIPKERESSFPAFLIGLMIYTVLLIM